jgi:chitin synthase
MVDGHSSSSRGMITSFLQYLLMAPTYITVLNARAVRTSLPLHDVSLGTKGDNKVNTDLGVVSAGKDENKNQVEVALPTTETDINVAYEDAIYVLSLKTPKTESKADPATEQEDYYKMFRMDVLLVRSGL